MNAALMRMLSVKKIFLGVIYTVAALTILIQILFVLKFKFDLPITVFGHYPWLHDFALFLGSFTLIFAALVLMIYAMLNSAIKHALAALLFIGVGILSIYLILEMIQAKNY